MLPSTTRSDAAAVKARPRSGWSRWSWSEINLLLDIALFVTLCAAAVIVRFVFPPGPAAKGWLLWGLDYDAWSGIQFALLATLAVGILVHVMLHWSWVCNVAVSRLARDKRSRVDDGLQTIYGVGLLIVLLNVIGITVAAAMLTIKGPE
ncbi:MAG: DUF4405 domain-containing protein [Planctomycetia bacterium]|nr:DUF4405 domain-containing protein [Planctomycetia bacterium]